MNQKNYASNYFLILNIFCTIIFLNISFTSYSQSRISGIVEDSLNSPIIYANVLLKKVNSSSIYAYTNTDQQGKYIFNVSETGDFIVIFNAISYQSKTCPIKLFENQKTIQNIKLNLEVINLKEIIIKTSKPITIKKDTIVFDAKFFATGNESVVEDLLRKIPGLSISQSGTIKVGNQEVEKIMIDGDDFFEHGYKVLTKNMPSNPVDKIEVLQHYSENKLLKGLENSDKVALNLKLKDNAKRQWFGNMSLGYGLVSENRYEVRNNLMSFGKKNKYYFLSNLNNLGDDVIGDINDIIRPTGWDESASIGDNQSANSILDLNRDSPNLKQKRVNINNAEMLSLNSIFTLSPKIKIKTLGFFYTDKNSLFKNHFQSFTIENENFENTEKLELTNYKITGFGKIDFTYDISKLKTIVFTSKFDKNNDDNRSDLIFNTDYTNERLISNNQLIDQKIVYTNKFKDDKVFIMSGRYINEKTPQNYSMNRFFYQELFSQDVDNITQFSQNKMQFVGFEGHLLNRKKNGSLLELQLGNQFRNDNLLTSMQLKENETIIDAPLNYQNQLKYSVNDLYINSKYRFKFKNFGLLTQLNMHQLFNALENLEKSTTQNPFFVNPKISLDWEINKKNRVKSSYSLSTTNATVLDVYDNYVNNGFRSFLKGTGTFNQLDASTAFLNYTYGKWGDNFFSQTFITYTKNHDFFSTNTSVTQNYSQSDKIIIKNREFLIFTSNIDKYFKSISSNLKLTFGGSKSNYKNIINNSNLREVENGNLNYGLELRSGFRGIFNYHFGSKWNYNQITTTISNSFTDNTTFLDLSFVFNKKINFGIQTERYFFGNLDNESSIYYFMDFDVKYTFKQNKLIFSLLGSNLFNTETFNNYSITDISISKTEYRLQPRYVILKMEYRF